MISRVSRRSFLVAAAAAAAVLRAEDEPRVITIKTPNGGLQPQAAVDSKGVLHLIYLYGEPGASDIGYVRRSPGGEFSEPIRVNSFAGSAIASGAVRGAHIAIGKSDSVHVAWNGSTTAQPKGPRDAAPILYARFDEQRKAFEPQRSVMTTATGIDGGGTLAADAKGHVYVTWCAQGQENGKPLEGEAHRRVWMTRSENNGRTFEAERPISPAESGACACCGMAAGIDDEGNIYFLYRSAREVVHRDINLLTSRDGGRKFQAVDVHHWEIGACPMSTASIVAAPGRVWLSWETNKQVYFAPVNVRTGRVGEISPAPGQGDNRKHPSIAVNENGELLLVWTEGTGMHHGGSLAWQTFDSQSRPHGARGGEPGLPALDFATSVAIKNHFLVIA